MKRGIVLTLLVALVLLLPAQAALATVAPPGGAEPEVPVAVDGPGTSDAVGQDTSEEPAGRTSKEPKVKQNVKQNGNSKGVPPGQAKPPGKPASAQGKPSAPSGRGSGPSPVTSVIVEPDVKLPGAQGTGGLETASASGAAVETGSETSVAASVPSEQTVYLHGPHVGADSTTFGWEWDTGGLTDKVVWHFVLNGLDPGTGPAALTVTFKHAGEVTVTGAPVGNGKTQHFYVGTPDHDVIVGAYAVVESEAAGKLVLSHVSYQRSEPDDEKPDDEKPDGEKPDGEKPDDEKPDGTKPDGGDEPTLPYTEVIKPAGADDYLPYTGDPATLLMSVALFAAFTGGRLRRASRR